MAFTQLKKDLALVKVAVDRHEYRDVVQFFDAVYRVLGDHKCRRGVQKEVQQLRECAMTIMPHASKCSQLTGQPMSQPRLVTADRHWATREQTSAAHQQASLLTQIMPAVPEVLDTAPTAVNFFSTERRMLQSPAHVHASASVEGMGGPDPATEAQMASLAAAEQQLQDTSVSGAMALCATVRHLYGARSHTYKVFLETINKSQNIPQVIKTVRNLFADRTWIVDWFIKFVPPHLAVEVGLANKGHVTGHVTPSDKYTGKRKDVEARPADHANDSALMPSAQSEHACSSLEAGRAAAALRPALPTARNEGGSGAQKWRISHHQCPLIPASPPRGSFPLTPPKKRKGGGGNAYGTATANWWGSRTWHESCQQLDSMQQSLVARRSAGIGPEGAFPGAGASSSRDLTKGGDAHRDIGKELAVEARLPYLQDIGKEREGLGALLPYLQATQMTGPTLVLPDEWPEQRVYMCEQDDRPVDVARKFRVNLECPVRMNRKTYQGLTKTRPLNAGTALKLPLPIDIKISDDPPGRVMAGPDVGSAGSSIGAAAQASAASKSHFLQYSSGDVSEGSMHISMHTTHSTASPVPRVEKQHTHRDAEGAPSATTAASMAFGVHGEGQTWPEEKALAVPGGGAAVGEGAGAGEAMLSVSSLQPIAEKQEQEQEREREARPAPLRITEVAEPQGTPVVAPEESSGWVEQQMASRIGGCKVLLSGDASQVLAAPQVQGAAQTEGQRLEGIRVQDVEALPQLDGGDVEMETEDAELLVSPVCVAFDQHSDVETAADSMTDAQSGQHAVIHSPSADDPPPAEPGAQAHVSADGGAGVALSFRAYLSFRDMPKQAAAAVLPSPDEARQKKARRQKAKNKAQRAAQRAAQRTGGGISANANASASEGHCAACRGKHQKHTCERAMAVTPASAPKSAVPGLGRGGGSSGGHEKADQHLGMEEKEYWGEGAALAQASEVKEPRAGTGRAPNAGAGNSNKLDKKNSSKLSLRNARQTRNHLRNLRFLSAGRAAQRIRREQRFMTGKVEGASRPQFKSGVPLLSSERATESTEQGGIRHTQDGGYVTLKLFTGESKWQRDEFTFFLPTTNKANRNSAREGGLLARKHLIRMAATQAQRLWVQSLLHSVKRSDALQERLKSQRVSKLTSVEGWDTKKLGRLIEAAAVGLGLFTVSKGQLCYANPRRPERLDELSVLSERTEQRLRRSFSRVHHQSRSSVFAEPLCCLCRIVGDTGVQGRLLYVEMDKWAHVNCICWSKGVYELGMHGNAGKIGMLCNVHHVVQQAQRSFCDFCGCPGATVACAAPGCCAVSHFGCAVLQGWSFYPEGRAFCDCCSELPVAQALGGLPRAWAPINLYRLTSRHLRVLPPRASARAEKGPAHTRMLSCDLADAGPQMRPQDGLPGTSLPECEEEPSPRASNVKETVCTKQPELLAQQQPRAGPENSPMSHLSTANSGYVDSHQPHSSSRAREVGASAAGNDPYSRLKASIERGEFDRITLKRLYAINGLLTSICPIPRVGFVARAREIVVTVAPAPEDNCVLGWSSFTVIDDAFWNILGHVITSNESTWLGCCASTSEDSVQLPHIRAAALLTDLLKKISVFPAISSSKSESPLTNLWRFNKEAEHTRKVQSAAIVMGAPTPQPAPKQNLTPFFGLEHAALKAKYMHVQGTFAHTVQMETRRAPLKRCGCCLDTVCDCVQKSVELQKAFHQNATNQHATNTMHAAASVPRGVADKPSGQPSGQRHTGSQGALQDLPANKKESPARAARKRESAAEFTGVQAPQRERDLAYNREELDAYSNNLLSKIAQGMEDGSIIARIGSLTVRRLGKIKQDDASHHTAHVIFPVGYSSDRIFWAPGEGLSKGGGRRTVYRCEILAGEQDAHPLFQVTVDGVQVRGASASEAWVLATRRPLRYRPNLCKPFAACCLGT